MGKSVTLLTKLSNVFDSFIVIKVDTFIRRFRSIMDLSTNSDECDALYKMETLDELERGLYEQVGIRTYI